jgi:type I restriction enzyme S subunit
MGTDWPAKKLGEVIELCYGKGISRYERKADGKYPFYGANGILDYTDKFLIDGEAIIVGRKGSAGELTRVSGKFWPSDVTYYVLGNDKINVDYAFYLLKGLNLQKFAVGVKPGINRNRVYEIEIKLPPLSEQKKILVRLEKLLAKVKEAKRLRVEALDGAAALIPASLQQMLEKKWPEEEIGNLALEIKSGFACGKSNEISNGIIHLRTHNIDLSGEINLSKTVKIPKKLINPKSSSIKKGDILFNNSNSKELVGKTILIHEDLDFAFSNHITRVRLDNKKIMPEWLLLIFKKYWRDGLFESMCTRWVGQAGINQTAMASIKIPLPPLSEQKKIVARLDALQEKIKKLQEYQKFTSADLRRLEQSILYRAFNK